MSPARSQPEAVDQDKHGHPRAHNADSANPAPVKRSALGPAGRPPGDRTPELALTHNQVAEPRPPPNNFTHTSLTRPDCTDKRNSELVGIRG